MADGSGQCGRMKHISHRFKILMYNVCVFCGSGSGNDPVYVKAARDVARLLVEKGCHLVYGGGKLGLMGVVAEAALAAGGYVTGIAPKSWLV
jgi:predicted Rossmann-fold nucleotide-binding protein